VGLEHTEKTVGRAIFYVRLQGEGCGRLFPQTALWGLLFLPLFLEVCSLENVGSYAARGWGNLRTLRLCGAATADLERCLLAQPVQFTEERNPERARDLLKVTQLVLAVLTSVIPSSSQFGALSAPLSHLGSEWLLHSCCLCFPKLAISPLPHSWELLLRAESRFMLWLQLAPPLKTQGAELQAPRASSALRLLLEPHLIPFELASSLCVPDSG
jgi:hypothetical protein